MIANNFVRIKYRKVIDIICGNTYVRNDVQNSHYSCNCNMSSEESCLDHKHINFEIGGSHTSITFYHNPQKANWEINKADGEIRL